MSNIKRVCVFASSCNFLTDNYYKDAQEFGALIAEAGMDMVYGGSSLGLMWACAEQVKIHGGQIIGVMPEKLHNMGVYTDECVELHITPCMRSRKAKMDELSDAVVALAGGFGTLEEISEMIVQKQLGYNQKAIVFLNTDGFYDKLISFFEEMISQNFARDTARELYYVANNPMEALNYLKNYQPKNIAITKADIYKR